MFKRFRRLRANDTIRDLVRETILTKNDLMYPLFVKQGQKTKVEVASMPGVYQMGIEDIVKECHTLNSLGLNSILLFAIPEVKDSVGSECLCDNSIIAQTIKAIKSELPNMHITTDLCFCEYTDHGHCGILDPNTHSVDNDATLEISAAQALVHAKAGANMIAPSGMMDGIIETLRKTLDENGFGR
jgi:porphobilinogen synthase